MFYNDIKRIFFEDECIRSRLINLTQDGTSLNTITSSN